MLLRLYKYGHPLTMLITMVWGVLLWLPTLLNPNWAPIVSEGTQLYSQLSALCFSNMHQAQIAALVLVLVESVIVQQMNTHHMIIESQSTLPQFFYIIAMAVFTPFCDVLPMAIANFFLIIALNYALSSDIQQKNQMSRFFLSGFWLGMGVLFYSPMFVLVVLLMFACLQLRYFNLRELVSPIIGMVVPIGFYFYYLFMTDKTAVFVDELVCLTTSRNIHLSFTLPVIIAGSFLVLKVFLATMIGQRSMSFSKVITRKYYSVQVCIILLVLFIFFVVPCASYASLSLSAFGLAFIMSTYMSNLNTKFWSELLFLIFFASVWVVIICY